MTAVPPLCRFCGNPIPKQTGSAYFGAHSTHSTSGIHREKPRSVEEARALLGDIQILSHRWERDDAGAYIGTAYTWDGSSYVDRHFCKPKCAENLGRLLAEQAHCTSDYNNAVRRHRLKGERNA